MEDRIGSAALGAFFGIIIACLLVGMPLKGELNTLKREAVARGDAEWKVDENGGTTWQWKE